jgi:hypothetical protein
LLYNKEEHVALMMAAGKGAPPAVLFDDLRFSLAMFLASRAKAMLSQFSFP